jgi:hypothetical protein
MYPQIELGEWLKREGMKNVLEITPGEWKAAFFASAVRILEANLSVTAEEVVAEIGYPPNHKNAIGAAMNSFAKAWKLVPTYEKSLRNSRHAAVIARWRHTA